MSILRRSRTALLLLLLPLTLLLSGCSGLNLIELMQQPEWGACGTVYVVLALVALIDVVGGDDYETAGKVVWALLIVLFPFLGALLYFFFGRD